MDKYVWTIAVKDYFTNINSLPKITQSLKNSDLQLLQFRIRLKCRQRVSKVLNCKNYLEEFWKRPSKIFTVLLRSCDCFKPGICHPSSFIFEKKCWQRKSKALKSKTGSKPVLKLIWTTADKELFQAVNILT